MCVYLTSCERPNLLHRKKTVPYPSNGVIKLPKLFPQCNGLLSSGFHTSTLTPPQCWQSAMCMNNKGLLIYININVHIYIYIYIHITAIFLSLSLSFSPSLSPCIVMALSLYLSHFTLACRSLFPSHLNSASFSSSASLCVQLPLFMSMVSVSPLLVRSRGCR